MQDKIKKLIDAKDFSALENIWLGLIEDEATELSEFFKITEELKKSQAQEQAILFLEILASHYDSANEKQKRLEVLKKMAFYTHDHTTIKPRLIRAYEDLYRNSPYLEQYLELSGIKKEEALLKAIERLEEYLKYDVGNYFYFERFGMGEVKEVFPAKKEIVIDFEKQKRYYVKFDIAQGLLMPVPESHFLYKKYKKVDELKKLANSEPVALVRYLLKSFGEPLSIPQIKTLLQGVVEEESGKWWERVRKKVEADENIRVSAKHPKTYQYVEAAVDKIDEAVKLFENASIKEQYILAEDYARKSPEVFKKILPALIARANKDYPKEPTFALETLLLCSNLRAECNFSYTLDDILKISPPQKIIHTLQNFGHKRLLLGLIKERNPEDWMDIFRKLIFKTDDFKLLDELEKELKFDPAMLQDIYQTILLMAANFPQQYRWLVKRLRHGELNEFLTPAHIPKLFRSLEYIKGIKSLVMKVLTLERFDAILKQANDEQAGHILASVENCHGLVDYEKQNFLKIIEYHFPHLSRKEEEVIYATEGALRKKKEELNRLLSIEIPENKKEISRAREYGDLSENFEYKAAKERQDQLYQRVRELEAGLARVKIIDFLNIDTSVVSIGTTVTLKNLNSGELIPYTILGPWDSDLSKNIISNESPLGQRILGKSCEDRIKIDETEYEIVKIEKGTKKSAD